MYQILNHVLMLHDQNDIDMLKIILEILDHHEDNVDELN
jgi:hypothetical protein